MDHERTEEEGSSLTTADVARVSEKPREESNERQEPPRRELGVMNHANEPDRPFAGQGGDGSSKGGASVSMPLFSPSEAADLRTRWENIQVGFVDEPRGSVERADKLVAEAISHLAQGFALQRKQLEHHWAQGNDVSTEELRLSLRLYRSFFERLLTV